MKKILTFVLALAVIAGAAQAQNNNTRSRAGQSQRQTTTQQQNQRSGNQGSVQQNQRSNNNNQATVNQGNNQNMQQGQPQQGKNTQQGQQPQNQNNKGQSNQNSQKNMNQGQYGPEQGQVRIDDAKQTMDNARQDYKDTRTQVKVDNRQQPTYQRPADRQNRQMEKGKPQVPPQHEYTRDDRVLRTNASRIVVYTDFRNRAEAMDYVERLLEERYYEVESYTSSTIKTSMVLIPTGFNSTTMFAMKFTFSSYAGGVRVYMTAQYRPSSVASALYNLIFQPDSSYATYYAWNVLEDIADSLPHYRIAYDR